MKLNVLTTKVKLPDSITAAVSQNRVTLKGPKGEVSREFRDPVITLKTEDGMMFISSSSTTKREKMRMGSIEAHINNMIIGATRGFTYKLKICSGHFPMNVAIAGSEFIIKNFLGEKFPRTLTLRKGAAVRLDGQDVIVEGTDKDVVGQCAADIEKLTIVKNRDRRIFQDGIYIVDKAGKSVVAS